MLQLFRDSHYIDKFTIYGERHSGTNFLESCIKQQFGLELTYFFGFKHWFGFTKPEIISHHKIARSTLFIGIVRNPYEWLGAMALAPHHVNPAIAYDFIKLITQEWSSFDDNGKEILHDRNYQTKKRYKNIFELRKEKCYYLNSIMPVIAKNYVLLSYDSFLKNHQNYLNIIGNRFHLRNIGKAPDVFQKRIIQYNDYQKSLVDSSIDWSIEESLGFFKR